MKIRRAVLVVGVLAVLSGPAGAESGHPLVTGGGEGLAPGGFTFKMTTNAVVQDGNVIAGKIEVHREEQGLVPELVFHADVRCADVSSDGRRAVLAGPVRIKEGQQQPEGTWAVASVLDLQNGPGDFIRVRFDPQPTAVADCANADDNAIFPAIVTKGNFEVRPEN